MAPEVVLRAGHGPAVDWWSLGALLVGLEIVVYEYKRVDLQFDMLVGSPPFTAPSSRRVIDAILKAKIRLPATMSHEVEAIGRASRQNNRTILGSKPHQSAPQAQLGQSTRHRRRRRSRHQATRVFRRDRLAKGACTRGLFFGLRVQKWNATIFS